MEQVKIHRNSSLLLTTLGSLHVIQLNKKVFLTLQYRANFLQREVKQIFAYVHWLEFVN